VSVLTINQIVRFKDRIQQRGWTNIDHAEPFRIIGADDGFISLQPLCATPSKVFRLPIYVARLVQVDVFLTSVAKACEGTIAAPTTTILTPHQMTRTQLDAVQAVIREGSEVATRNLVEYLNSARRIGFVVCDEQLACVGAIKAARLSYIRTISRKSGYALEPENCVGEFGYVVTRAAFRRRGLARALSAELLKDFVGNLYATTRDDNPGIHAIVRENGFASVGRKWPSTEHPESALMLWVKK
jgi:ribosomal protein S18 acetylase RimI-like enzyme